MPKPEDFQPEILTRADGIRVRVLPTVLGDNDDVYRQVKRQGEIAIFKPQRLSTTEVVLIQLGPPHPLDTHKEDYDLVDRYPSTELWGHAAWSWLSSLLAQAHFQFILQYGPHKDFHGSSKFRATLKGQKAARAKTEPGT